LVTAPTARASDRQETFGELLREWRIRRRFSQLELSGRAAASTRHLSYLENGRSRPSREMALHLADELDVPLRERNRLLVAAGFAPLFRETGLDADEMAPAREAIERILAAQDPYPAVVVDRCWNLVAANQGLAVFTALLPVELLTPPVNVVRASLHPDGLARHIANFDEYATHMVGRIRRDAEATGDPSLTALLDELRTYPALDRVPATAPASWGGALVPIHLVTEHGELSFFSTIATFGTPNDITLDELSIEMFFPADASTAAALPRRPARPA
jgi:transcriptional regulator with XRE-family HTH domain